MFKLLHIDQKGHGAALFLSTVATPKHRTEATDLPGDGALQQSLNYEALLFTRTLTEAHFHHKRRVRKSIL